MIDHGGRGRTSRWGMTKDEVVASAAMVCAGHRLAAEAGVEMLRRGGNAVDAAMAAAWAVGVVEPWMSGAGGVGAMVVHHGGRQVLIRNGIREGEGGVVYSASFENASGAFNL